MPDESANGAGQFEAVAALAATAERHGFDSLWVPDGFDRSPDASRGPSTVPVFEAYSLLGGLAVRTETVGLAAFPTGCNDRHPSMLAKIAATLDVISHGRAIVTFGSEPDISRRDVDRLGEALQVTRSLMVDEPASFAGEHYRIDRAPNRPRPVRSGGSPLVVVVESPDVLDPAARFADAVILGGDVAAFGASVAALHDRCEAAGRDPGAVQVLWSGRIAVASTRRDAERLEHLPRGKGGPQSRGAHDALLVAGDPDRVAEDMAGLVEAGADGFVLAVGGVDDPDTVALAAATLRTAIG